MKVPPWAINRVQNKFTNNNQGENNDNKNIQANSNSGGTVVYQNTIANNALQYHNRQPENIIGTNASQDHNSNTTNT